MQLAVYLGSAFLVLVAIVVIFGWVMIALGVLTMLISLAWLGLRRSHGLEVDTLIQSGPYSLTRNPQIVGFSLGMIGFVMVWPSWHMTISLLLYVVLFHLMVLTEEEHLLSRYGNEYLRYCEETPRYIGVPRSNHKSAA
jgi:protein-S-isoprenylcysteine O-methyltransferase Ste14